MITLVLIVAAIIFLDALVSAAEAAIFSVPISRVYLLAEKRRAGKTLLKLKESMERPIGTLAILSNLFTTGGSVVVGTVAVKALGEVWLGAFAAVMTLLIMLFAEIIPKRFGERYAEKLSLAVAPSIYFLSIIFTPVNWFVEKITGFFGAKNHALTSEEEIAFLARIGGKEGIIEEDESRLIQRAFRLNDITAGDMMTAKPFVTFVDGAKTIGELAEFIKTTKHSRLPVFEQKEDNVIGVVHQRDLLRALANNEFGRKIKEYAGRGLIIPESKLGDDLLRDFQEKRIHLGIVVSEYGNVVGVVGLEDVLEELVGEIIDEKDVTPELIKRLSKNEILAHGQTRIDSVNHFFNTEIKSKKTLNGFLLDQFGRLPEVGEEREFDGLLFRIEDADNRRIERVRVVKK